MNKMALPGSLLSVVCLSICGLGLASAQLTVNVTPKGDYTISRKDGTVWLRSAPTFFVVNWVKYSSADSVYHLTLKGVNQTTSGGYLRHDLYYEANQTAIVASIHVYNSGEIGFSVTYPHTDPLTLTRGGTADGVISGFPGFLLDPAPARLAYTSYGMASLEAAIGRWQNGSTLLYGGRQGSGPLTLFDKQNNALVMGPASAFTVLSLWQDLGGAAVYWGIMGAVTQVPAGFSYNVILVESEGKVGEGLRKWAMAVRSRLDAPVDKDVTPRGKRASRGKMTSQTVKRMTSSDPFSDSVIDTVGYWTGPGSAYYRQPEAGKTYEDTLYDVKKAAAYNVTVSEPLLDYIHVEVDDWWYHKGQEGGVKNWTAVTSLLPHGLSGVENLTRWSIAAACGVWSADNVYSTHNGGKYNFTVGQNCTLPKDQTFWDDLFKQAVDDWIRIFVQRDMEAQYMCMTSGDVDVSLLVTWLSQMNVSAVSHGLELVYSSALPRMVLEAGFRHNAKMAVEVGPGPENVTAANLWTVGVANMLVDALQLHPFFGIIKSYGENDTATDSELSPLLYSLVATLTGGPLAIGDEVGKTDRNLMERCCSVGGQVLSPTVPATPIDDQLQEMAWGYSALGGLGDVWSAHTATRFNTAPQDNFYHGIILVAGMTRPYNITPASTGLSFTAESGGPVFSPSKLFRHVNPYILHPFTDSTPFTVSGCSLDQFCLYHAAPVFTFRSHEVVLLGDLTKWVPMSPQRVLKVEVGDTIVITTRGTIDEKVFIWLQIDGRLQTLEHRIGLDGTGHVVFELPDTSSANKMAAGVCSLFMLGLCAWALGKKM